MVMICSRYGIRLVIHPQRFTHFATPPSRAALHSDVPPVAVELDMAADQYGSGCMVPSGSMTGSRRFLMHEVSSSASGSSMNAAVMSLAHWL